MSKVFSNYYTGAKRDRNKLAQILKRKRLELGLTLEKVSDGICSTSYLSKIENCLVDVDDLYYNLLFEKVHLKYADIIEHRLVPTNQEVLKWYLNNNLKLLQDYISHKMNDHTYSEIEVEQFVLFYNIINHNLSESEILFKKIALTESSLSTEENQFILFLKALYYLKSGMFYDFDKIINQFNKAEIIDKTLEVAFYDLFLDYYFLVNDAASFDYYLNQMNHTDFIVVFQRVTLKHNLQKMIFQSSQPNNFQKFSLMKDSIDANNQDLYQYYYVYYLIATKRYKEGYEFIKEIKINSDLAPLYAIIVNDLNDLELKNQFLNLLIIKEQKMSAGWTRKIVDYYQAKFQNYNNSYLHNYLKSLLIYKPLPITNSLLYKHIENEYINLSYDLGHYKEIVKYWKSIR